MSRSAVSNRLNRIETAFRSPRHRHLNELEERIKRSRIRAGTADRPRIPLTAEEQDQIRHMDAGERQVFYIMRGRRLAKETQ